MLSVQIVNSWETVDMVMPHGIMGVCNLFLKPSTKSKLSQNSLLILLFNKIVYFIISSSTAIYNHQNNVNPSTGKDWYQKEHKEKNCKCSITYPTSLVFCHLSSKFSNLTSLNFQKLFSFHSLQVMFHYSQITKAEVKSLNYLWCHWIELII